MSQSVLSWSVIGQLSQSLPLIGREWEWGQQQSVASCEVWGLPSLRRAETATHLWVRTRVNTVIQRHVRPREGDTWMILDTWVTTSNISADEGSSRGARPAQVQRKPPGSGASMFNFCNLAIIHSSWWRWRARLAQSVILTQDFRAKVRKCWVYLILKMAQPPLLCA